MNAAQSRKTLPKQPENELQQPENELRSPKTSCVPFFCPTHNVNNLAVAVGGHVIENAPARKVTLEPDGTLTTEMIWTP